MTDIRFFKTLTAGVALTLASCPQAFAADTGSCGPNCVYTYENGTLTYSPIDSSQEAIINKRNDNFGLSSSVQNVIVSEGITSIKTGDSWPHTMMRLGEGGGKLTLPSTLTEFESNSTYGMKFSTIEINSTNLTIPHLSIFNTGPSGTINIIMPASENLHLDMIKCEGQNFNGTLNVQCKGNESVCAGSLASLRATTESLGGHYQSEYYSETDADGNIIQYHDTGYYKYDSQGNLLESWNLDSTEQYDASGKILAKYDNNGNQIGFYKYDGAGNLTAAYENGVATYKRTSYTPVEAAAAANRGDKNSITFTFK